MSTVKKLAGQTAIYGLSTILGRLLNYLLVPIYVNAFTPAEYGSVSLLYSYVAFFIVILMFGMETTFFRFVNKSDDKEKTFNQAFSIVLIINAIFLITIFSTSHLIANYLQHPEFQQYIVWFGVILVFDATSSLFLAKLRYLNQAKRFAVIQLSSIGTSIVLNLFFIYVLLPSNPDFGIGYIFLANLIASFVKPVLLYKEVSSFRFTWNMAYAKTMMIFAIPLVIGSFGGIINEVLDRQLIYEMLKTQQLDLGFNQSDSLIYAETQVGIYSACYKLSILITLFITAFRYAAEPFFFAQESNENKDKVYSKVMTWFIIVVTLIFLTISINLDIFKYFIPNEAYWVGLKVVPVLLLANVCLGIYYNQSIWYKLADKTKYGAFISIGGAIITVVMNLLLIPIMGYMGSAWTTLAVYFSMMIASYYFGQKHYPIKYNLRKAALYIFTSLILFFIGYFIEIESFGLAFTFHTVLILVFIGIVMFIERPLREFRKKENG